MTLSSADTQAVYSLLQNALDQQETVRKPAEISLESISGRPGFCSCLLEIILRKELDSQGSARWLAAVYFKNSINKYWRSRRDSIVIDEGEKRKLRSRLLDILRDENNKVAVQLSLLVAKIARHDYPRDWPELFPTLLLKLESEAGDLFSTLRIYLALNQVLKELSTKRLGVDQRNFAHITQDLFEHTWRHWYGDTQTILQGLASLLSSGSRSLEGEQEQMFSLITERWLLCCKCLRRMMMFGFQSDFKTLQMVPAVKQLVPAYLEATRSFLECGSRLQQSPLLPFVNKASLKLMRTICDVQSTHPYSFSSSDIMLPCIHFCFQHIVDVPWPTEDPSVSDKFIIQCMILLQSVVRCVAYRQVKIGRVVGAAPSLEEVKGKLSDSAQSLWKSFFTQERVVAISTLLIQRYFMLTASDLSEWDSDPETFHHEQGQLQLRDRLRPCAEALFLNIFEQFKETLAPVVMELLKKASEMCPPPSPNAEVSITPALLYKDACYDAVGVASYDLYDYMDFHSWFVSVLSLEVANSHPNGRIVRRRVAWLFGQWVSKVKNELRRPVYSTLLLLLGDADTAVKIAACQSMRTLIDDVHFYEEEFVEFVEPTLRLLFELLQVAAEFDTQLQVLNLVSLIIERLREKVVPCADKILFFLPQVWSRSESQSLLRVQVILALQQLVLALGPQSPLCYSLLIPILHYSTDITQPDELNMVEDGMQLWLVTLRHAPAMTPELLQLFPHLVPIVERNFDFLLVALRIIESYIMIGGPAFVQLHGQSVVKVLHTVVGNVKEKATLVTLSVIDTLIQCYPAESPPVLEQVLQKLAVMVCGEQESDLVKANSATVLARVLLQNPTYFCQLMAAPSTLSALSTLLKGKTPLILFVDCWLEKMDSVSSAVKQKLSALALCTLLTVPEPQILDRLELIFSVCSGVLNEPQREEKDVSNGLDFWVSQTSDDGDVGPSELEYSRRRQVSSVDPVFTLSVGPVLKEKLQACIAVHGLSSFNQATSKVHPSLLSQLQHLLQT